MTRKEKTISFLIGDADITVNFSYIERPAVWGEDIDGNRGITCTNVTDIEVLGVSMDGEDLEYDNLNEDLQDLIDTKINEEI